jgi:ketosteroid isomerase-like protein
MPDYLDPEIVWTTTGTFVEPNTYAGHEGVRRYLRALADDLEDVHVEPEELIDAGEHVIVPARLTGRGRLSGAPVELKFALLCSLRGGKIVRIHNYWERAGDLEAVGLAE